MHRRLLAVLAGTAGALLVASPAAAAPIWAVVPGVNPVTTENTLTAVHARTATDAWAVGFYKGPARHDGRIMLAERWDGTSWRQVPTPNVQFFDEKLLAVHASGANDAWAVGSTNQTGFATTNPIAAHWDGGAWMIVSTPATTGSAKSILDGVVDFGPTNAWAVGRSRSGRALVEHWDGAAWSIVPTPDPVPPAGSTLAGATLTGLSALSPTDIWAVGSFVDRGPTGADFPVGKTQIQHWNGTVWSVVPSPGGNDASLAGVSVVPGSAEAWAVGSVLSAPSTTTTLILHHPG
jgi:hypothetical protein